MPVSLNDIRLQTLARVESLPEGEPLDAMTAALIDFAVNVSATTLDAEGTDAGISRALDAGASAAQIQEVMVLLSALGAHSLMVGTARLADRLRERGNAEIDRPLDAKQREIGDRTVGADRYWESVEREVPGFLDALLRLSPPAFEGFMSYCSLPWKSAALRALPKELISLAADATPTHRFMPGYWLHLENAIKLGAGRVAILQALEIAAASPIHSGIPRVGSA